jgi:hypothetical protein
VNWGSCLLQVPLTVSDAVCHIQNIKSQHSRSNVSDKGL